ncbi:histidine kinase [Paenibacillus oryzisoli]|uniref:sensor histidine kinase n=1 Tax=Paenibacillus oryzisoli TaxID=1850517 RepID=UPI003D2A354F
MFKKNLSFKLIASLSTLIMVVFLISGYVTYTVYLKMFTGEISKQFAKANEQAAARVEFQIQNMYKSTNYIVFHPYIEDILRRSAERAEDTFYNRLLDQDELARLLNQISIDEPKLSSMYVYNTKGSGYFFENNSGTVIPLSDADYTTIKQSLEGSNGEIVWKAMRISSIESSGYKNVISAARYMKNKQQELYGILILFWDESLFGAMLDDLTKGENAQVVLLDDRNRVIYTNHKKDGYDLDALLQAADSQTVTIGGQPIYVSRSTTQGSHMTLISALSLQSFNQKSRGIFQIALYSGLVSIGLASLLIFFTGRRLLGPLRTLVAGMKKLRGGRFDTRIRISTQDELAFLGHSFNEMASNIESLVKEVYERKLHEREAELTALQAQLNPHFLYNTLDTIYMKLYLGENDEQAAQLVLSLSGLLRYALQSPNTHTTVQDEIEHIQKYINIQSARIGGRLETFIHVDDGVEGLPVIRLILQPLVENAFVHAFSQMSRICILRIKAYLQEPDMLCIEISDNGKGMTGDQVVAVLQLQERSLDEVQDAPKRGGIGLKTVIRRVNLLYGPPYGLTIFSEPDLGTTMKLVLPAHTREEGGSSA